MDGFRIRIVQDGVVGAGYDDGLLDGAVDGTTPAMVVYRAEVRLIDCATNELLGVLDIVVEHVRGSKIEFSAKTGRGP